jgi:predicted Rossmann fold nucleotide-binding protein DprA/Smf involved in DNA uptake
MPPKSLAVLRSARDELPAHRAWVETLLAELAAEGVKLTTVLDDDYPANLRLIFNLPPFLTYRGMLRADDARSVAVVGTREASSEGLERARRLAAQLAEAGVTVLSGLARGIDTAAHVATLEHGKRVFLLSSLVHGRPWARKYLERGAIEVADVDDIVRLLQSPEVVQARSDQRRQLSMALG